MPIKLIPIKVTQSVINAPAFIRAAKQALVDTQAEGVRLMATYPPQWPGSRYRRTGDLKRSWSMPPVRHQGNALVAPIFSDGARVGYNQKVEGMSQDPFFAARGWPNVRALVKLVNKQLPVRVQRAVDRTIAKGTGL